MEGQIALPGTSSISYGLLGAHRRSPLVALWLSGFAERIFFFFFFFWNQLLCVSGLGVQNPMWHFWYVHSELDKYIHCACRNALFNVPPYPTILLCIASSRKLLVGRRLCGVPGCLWCVEDAEFQYDLFWNLPPALATRVSTHLMVLTSRSCCGPRALFSDARGRDVWMCGLMRVFGQYSLLSDGCFSCS